MQTSALDLVWLACALDGEGHLSIKRRRRGKNGVLYSTTNLEVSVVNTDERFAMNAKRIMEQLVGHPVHLRTRQLYTGKTAYWVSVRALKDAAMILEPLLPHFVIKRDIAERIIAWAAIRQGKRGVRFTPQDIEFAASLGISIERPVVRQGEPSGQ